MKLRPAAARSTTRSEGPVTGSSTSIHSITSGPPWWVTRMANISTPLLQRWQRLVLADERIERVADSLQALLHVAERPAIRAQLGVAELVPFQRDRDRGARRRANAVRRHERLVDLVLGVVEAGLAAPSVLLPLPTDELAHDPTDRSR